jgi:hypothetical protein
MAHEERLRNEIKLVITCFALMVKVMLIFGQAFNIVAQHDIRNYHFVSLLKAYRLISTAALDLQPHRTYPARSVSTLGCPYSMACLSALGLVPFDCDVASAGVSARPRRTCPTCEAINQGCSCSPLCLGAQGLTELQLQLLLVHPFGCPIPSLSLEHARKAVHRCVRQRMV